MVAGSLSGRLVVSTHTNRYIDPNDYAVPPDRHADAAMSNNGY